jgi:hypothetical protein
MPRLEPARFRLQLDRCFAAGSCRRLVRWTVPGAPSDPGPFTGVTAAPFLILCLEGRIDLRLWDGTALHDEALAEREAAWWAPGTWVAAWHTACPRYLRATFHPDHVHLAMKDDALRARGQRYVDLYEHRLRRVCDACGQGLLARLSRPGGEAAALDRFRALLHDLHDLLAPAPAARGRSSWLRLRDHLERHWDRPLDRATAARAAGVSPTQVSRLVRQHAGTTLAGHLHDLRLA